jgi:hypothetical protein
MSSNESRDVYVTFSIPVGTGGTECRSERGSECCSHGAPWGAPGKIDAARNVLAKAMALLEVLQAAQREGQLTEAGLCDLDAIQRFYSSLKAQVDKPG